jgi:hypothetical protein
MANPTRCANSLQAEKEKGASAAAAAAGLQDEPPAAPYVAHDAPQLRDRARARAILFGNQYILHQIKPE